MRKRIPSSPRAGLETGPSTIIEKRMEVVCACGEKLGEVDHLARQAIELASDSCHDGKPHRIPLKWVDHVNGQIHLSQTCADAIRIWQPARHDVS